MTSITGDESADKREIEHVVEWCSYNKHLLLISKTKEIIIDFKKGKSGDCTTVFTNGSVVKRFSSFKFLVLISWRTCPGCSTYM